MKHYAYIMCVEMIIHLLSQPTKKEQNFYRPFLFKHIVILFSIAMLLFIENVCTFNDSNNINNSKTNLTLSNHIILHHNLIIIAALLINL